MCLGQRDDGSVSNGLSFAAHHCDAAAGGRGVIKPPAVRKVVTAVLHPRGSTWGGPSRPLPPIPPAPSPGAPPPSG